MIDKKFAVVEKQFEYKGRDCIIVFNRNGYRCGYISVKKEVGGYNHRIEPFYVDLDIDSVALTFGGALPSHYSPKEAYYIGYDCGHIGQGIDKSLIVKYGLLPESEVDKLYDFPGDIPVSLDECVEICKNLVDELEEKYKGEF